MPTKSITATNRLKSPLAETSLTDMTFAGKAEPRKLDLRSLSRTLLAALKQKPAQTAEELKATIDRRLGARVPLTYICIALCRLVNDGFVALTDGRCSSLG